MKTTYRPNVAAILENAEGSILIAERIDVAGAWQFPQGGVDDGEDIAEALRREVQEELGLKPKHYAILEQREGYRYRFADGRIKKGKFHGQEQTYFRCQFLGKDKDIDLTADTYQEFSRTRWIQPKDFDLNWVPAFKKDVYAAVLKDFYGVEL